MAVNGMGRGAISVRRMETGAEMNALEVDVVLIEMMMSFWCNTMRLEDASRRRRRRRRRRWGRWGEEREENGAGNQLTR